MIFLDRQLPADYRNKLVAIVQLVIAAALLTGIIVLGFAYDGTMRKVLLISLTCILLSIYLTRHQHETAGTVLFLSTILVMTIRFAIHGQGINDVAFAILPLLLVISGMILTLRHYLIVVVLLVLSVLIVASATQLGFTQMHAGFKNQQDMWVDAIALIIILLTEASLVIVLVNGLLLAFQQNDQKQETLKNTQEELLKLNAELEQRVRERTIDLQQLLEEREAFNYTVSHDLRAPLRAVIGFAQAANDELASDPQAAFDFLQRVVKAGHRMNNLIDDLLRLSRASTTPLRLEKIIIADLVNDIIRDNIDTTRVSIELHDQNKASLSADRGLLQQLLLNLISNAVKYSSARNDPFVNITLEQKENSVIIAIRDNGIGFSEENAANLFKPFSRLENAYQMEGTGIGLAIVKRVVERHGGQVTATAKINEGAVFTVTLPL